MIHMRAARPASGAALRLAAAGCALAIAVTGCTGSSPRTAALARAPSASAGLAAPSPGGSAFTLMQMNLCLSGLAECYVKVAYPAAVQEAAGLIRQTRPDAVTLSEACRGDAARIARRTGYHLRFSTVIYRGAPFACIDPGGRGDFGDAVLTKAPIVRADGRAFRAQAGIERRRWLCVATRAGIEVCTAHLNTRSAVEVAGNDAQCSELAGILARRRAARTVIFGGDVNRLPSCAPAGFWTRSDASAGQDPGLQQVYGCATLRSPAVAVVPFAHSDHDALVVRARLRR
jgi:endonuclease/exonuclease/phosphatase (EEP) superfamily protein YafD